MPKKKVKKNNFEKQFQDEVHEVEKWVYERRKFLIKLSWVVGIVVVLLIISNLYLKQIGVGI
jgi:hypothetical protein